MNIFALNQSPVFSASLLVDCHVNKMCIESLQILCTSARKMRESFGVDIPEDTIPYKNTHENHPCVIWASTSYGNWDWLFTHFISLCREFKNRYGKQHACSRYVPEMLSIKRTLLFSNVPPGMTTFKACMPPEYRCSSVHNSYFNYYINEKLNLMGGYKRTGVPLRIEEARSHMRAIPVTVWDGTTVVRNKEMLFMGRFPNLVRNDLLGFSIGASQILKMEVILENGKHWMTRLSLLGGRAPGDLQMAFSPTHLDSAIVFE